MSNIPVTSSVLKNIRKIRGLRDYSQEYMGKKLGISARGYGGIETGETPLTLERLEKIAEILEVSPLQLLAFDEKLIFNNCSQLGMFQTIHNTSDAERDLYERQIKELKEEIVFLRSLIKKEAKN